MDHTNTLFSKILGLIDRRQFKRCVNAHDGDKGSRTLRCWDHLTVMLFAQIKQSVSGRAAVNCFNSHQEKLYHIGSNGIAKSTLNDANAKRSYKIYEEFLSSLIQQYQSQFTPKQAREMIIAIDSTQVILQDRLRDQLPAQSGKAGIKVHTVFCLDEGIPHKAIITDTLVNDIVIAKSDLNIEAGRTYVFDKGYYDFGWWFEIEKQGAHFVTRLKNNTKPQFVKEHSQPVGKNILSDHVIRIKSVHKKNRHIQYPKTLRRIIAKNDEGKEIQLVSNDFDSTAQEIADTYRARWKIELFFKWVKQKLKIKTFYGRSPNAIKTQIYMAMIAYLLLKMAHEVFLVGCSLKDFVRILAEQLMSRHHQWWQPFIPPERRRKKVREERKLTLFDVHDIPY